MINSTNLGSLIGSNVIDSDGDKIGSIGQIYVDTDTAEPTWASVKTGLFGMSETFVPIDQADQTGDDLRVPFTKEFVKDAPRIDVDGALEHSQEDELYAYYGNGTTGYTDTTTTDRADRTTDRSGAGYDVSGPETDDAMTRSEERLRVGTEKVETGRARMRKYVVTENVTQTVPVSREEVTIEREPITDANRGDAMAGGDLTSEEHEVVLTGERVTTSKETVPVERVRLGTETVTDQQQVTEEVAHEEIEMVDPNTTPTDQDTRKN